MPRKTPIKGNEIVNSDNQTNFLSTTEKTALTYHENVIEKGLETFIEVGQSLQYIRDNRLYRGDFKDFGDYVNERWGKGLSWAKHIISSTEVVKTLKENSSVRNYLPESEYQTRPLAKLKDNPELMAEVWEDAVAEAKKQYEAGLKKSDQPTHKDVDAKVKEYEQKIKELENNQKSLIEDREYFVDAHEKKVQEFNNLSLTVENQTKQIRELNNSIFKYENHLKSLQSERDDLLDHRSSIDDLIAKEADLKASEILERERDFLIRREKELENKEKELSTQLKSLKKNQSEVETAKKTLLGLEKWIEDLQRFNCFIKESTDSIISTTKSLQNLPDLTILTSEEKDLIDPRIASEIETFWDNSETFSNAMQKIGLGLKKLNKQVFKSVDVEVIND